MACAPGFVFQLVLRGLLIDFKLSAFSAHGPGKTGYTKALGLKTKATRRAFSKAPPYRSII